jgi:hypothetical protein
MDQVARDTTIKALMEQLELCRLQAASLDRDADRRSEMEVVTDPVAHSGCITVYSEGTPKIGLLPSWPQSSRYEDFDPSLVGGLFTMSGCHP